MSDDLYKVEKIINKKQGSTNQQWLYLIKWEGYDTDESTWEPEENLCYIPKVLEDFNNKWQAKQLLRKKKKQQKLEKLSEIKKTRIGHLQKIKKSSFREVVKSNEILDILDKPESPHESIPNPPFQLSFPHFPGILTKDPISKILGVREFEGTHYFAVLFKATASKIPSIGVFSMASLKHHGFSSLVGGYLIERLKCNPY